MPVTLNKLGSHRPPYVPIGGKSNFGKYEVAVVVVVVATAAAKFSQYNFLNRIVLFKQVVIE